MRVGIIAPEFPPEIGGMQTYAYEFSRELAARGYEVTVFTRPHPEGEIEDASLHVLPVLRGRRREDEGIVRKYDMDVWHVMNAAYSWLARATDPVIVSVHGNDFLRPYIPVERPNLGKSPILWRSKNWIPALEAYLGRRLTQRSVRRSLPRAAHIVANSRFTERVLLERYPACRGKTSAGMVGVSSAFLQAPLLERGAQVPSFITVARLDEPRKNVDLVLRALAALRSKHDFSYTVVGDGRLRPELEQLTRDLGLSDRVDFVGFVAKERLTHLLGRCDLFILISSIIPGSHEGFGIAYLEANACGAPVLAARLAGAAEAVDEGTSGVFVDTVTVSAAVKALDAFLSGGISFDPSACRAFAATFTWSRVVEHAVGFYTPRAAKAFPEESPA